MKWWRRGGTVLVGCVVDPGLDRGLLAEAIPLAKILVTQTRVLFGTDVDVEKAARQYWALLGKHPDLAVYRSHVLYNLALNCSFVGALEKAARYYRQAAALLKGQEQSWAYFNLAEVFAHLGRSRAAGAVAEHCLPLFKPEDRHMYASLMAYRAVVRGDNTRALSLIEAALDDPACPPLSRSHLWHYQTHSPSNQLGAVTEAEEVVERTWRYASERHHLWICDRLTKLPAEMDALKGVKLQRMRISLLLLAVVASTLLALAGTAAAGFPGIGPCSVMRP